MTDCLFCSIDTSRIIAENNLSYAIKDGYPVTEGHVLVIPKRHVDDYFGMTPKDVNAGVKARLYAAVLVTI
jgi:diadenosine tetraphosphate (Ap4A) HIT family hydrolase